MCGILGIIGVENVVTELYKGLLALQHRGQDGAGMITFDGSAFHPKKGIGLISEVFGERHFQRLKGNIGIGHVRYPTWGASTDADVQPFKADHPYGIVIGHNGQVTNYSQLEKELRENCKRRLNSSCDGEAILHVFADELDKQNGVEPEHIFNAVEGVFERVRGSYSVVAIVAGIGLVAFRDPYGIRPLVIGKSKEGRGYAVASESVALDMLGYTLESDIAPGNAVFVDYKGNVHKKELSNKAHHPCIFEYVYFARPDSVIDGISVYEARLGLGKRIANECRRSEVDKNIDVVIPVPDTARPVATAIAEELSKQCREGFIKNRYIGRTFIMPGQEKRRKSVRLKLNTIKSVFEGKRVLIVDDSIVRGNTSHEIVKMARNAGAKEVYLALSCPPLRYPCVYGIDMSTRGEFVAKDGKSIEGVRKFVGADWLIYQRLDDMISAVKEIKPDSAMDFCTACFTGKYPTPDITPEVLQEFEQNRSKPC